MEFHPWIFIVTLMLLEFGKLMNASEIDLPKAQANCGQIIVKAEARTNYAYTPGFPNPFPGDAKCMWAIYSAPGKRIRLEFQKFYLLQPVAGKCEYHYVVVKSPFTLFTMGPYCGETSLPTIVSTGNLIYVELHTLIPVTTDNYQGFKLAFKETEEASSYELRPDNSVGDEIVTIDPDTLNRLSPTAPPTTTPRTTKSTTKSWRFKPSRRPPNTIYRRPVTARPPPPQRRPPPPSFVNPNNNRPPPGKTRVVKPTKNPKLRIEIIVAIVVAGVIAVAIIIMIALKMVASKKKSRDKKKREAESKKEQNPPPEKTANGEPQMTLPGMYLDPNQQHYIYDPNTAYPMLPMGHNYVHQMSAEDYPATNSTHSSRKKTTDRRHHRHDREKRAKRKRRTQRR